MNKSFYVFIFCLFVALPTSAEESIGEKSYDDQLLIAYGILDERCRGFSDEISTTKGCQARDTVRDMLTGLGFCYGKKGQADVEMNWHKCEAASLLP